MKTSSRSSVFQGVIMDRNDDSMHLRSDLGEPIDRRHDLDLTALAPRTTKGALTVPDGFATPWRGQSVVFCIGLHDSFPIGIVTLSVILCSSLARAYITSRTSNTSLRPQRKPSASSSLVEHTRRPFNCAAKVPLQLGKFLDHRLMLWLRMSKFCLIAEASSDR